MKAFIDRSGKIAIVPETETEEYALRSALTKVSIQVDDIKRGEKVYYRGSSIVISSRCYE